MPKRLQLCIFNKEGWGLRQEQAVIMADERYHSFTGHASLSGESCSTIRVNWAEGGGSAFLWTSVNFYQAVRRRISEHGILYSELNIQRF
jgi:hypothetical protein